MYTVQCTVRCTMKTRDEILVINKYGGYGCHLSECFVQAHFLDRGGEGERILQLDRLFNEELLLLLMPEISCRQLLLLWLLLLLLSNELLLLLLLSSKLLLRLLLGKLLVGELRAKLLEL